MKTPYDYDFPILDTRWDDMASALADLREAIEDLRRLVDPTDPDSDDDE